MAFDTVLGDAVKHEDVDEDALIERLITVRGPYTRRLAVAQLSMSPVVVFIGVAVLQKIRMLESLVANAYQLVVVFTWHAYVDVIVPGDESVMTDSP